jgi:hypothetical protein
MSCESTEFVRVAGVSQFVVYGDDDRREPYEAPDTLAHVAYHSTAALVLRSTITVGADGVVELAALPAQEEFGLCPDERFASQPSGALCTAVLVAPDVALTAGHCLTWMSCSKLALVFGYHYTAPGVVNVLHQDDAYDCSEVLALEVSARNEPEQLDYAFVRLERTVAERYLPVSIEADPTLITEGSPVSAVGHGAGVPTKIAGHAFVTDSRRDHADYFLASIDNFVGGSGSGVFDADARLVGLAVRGELDFAPTDAGCQRIVRVDDEPLAQDGRGEKVGYVGSALRGLCKKSPVGAPLCPQLPPRVAAGASPGTGACHISRVGARRERPTDYAFGFAYAALSALMLQRRKRC